MRSILKIIILMMLIIGGYFAWEYLKDPTRYPITKVLVQANYSHISDDVVKEIILPFTTDTGFFTLNPQGLKQALLEEPWISKVSVRRVWPGTLRVNIQEQNAIARWNEHGLLTDNFQIIEPKPESFPENLPVLFGPDSQAKMVFETYQQLLALFQPLELRITEVALNSRHAWRFKFEDGVTVDLGRGDILQKSKRLQTSLNKIKELNDKPAKAYDIRYPNGIVITYENIKKMKKQ